MHSRPQAWLALSLTVLAASWAVVLAKDSLTRIEPFTFAWLQVALGMLVLAVLRPVLRRRSTPERTAAEVTQTPPDSTVTQRTWVLLLVLGVSNFTIARAAFLFALELVSATTHSYIVNFTALVTMAMSIVFLRERPSWIQGVGVIIVLAGVRLFFGEAPSASETTGILWLGLGVLALATTNTTARILAIREGKARLTAWQISTRSLWIGGAPLVITGVCLQWQAVASIEARDWAVLALGATTSIAVGPFVFNAAFRVLRSYEASVLATSGLVYTAFLAWLILDEPLRVRQGIAIATMLAGIALTQIQRPLRRR